MKELRAETEKADANTKKKQIDELNPGYGYGGKFGLESDRMDSSAMGHDYIGKVEKHSSQLDHSSGFGGKFGVQSDRVDKSAVSWDHKEKVEKHSSQKDYSSGFGGKFGVQEGVQDKSALGWDHIEKVEKHESQTDHSKGFGGKFGVQEDRKDKSAHGWDYVERAEKHESQLDHKKGFGGAFGVQSDRMDKSAIGFQSEPDKVGTNYTKVKPDIGGAKPSNLRAKFENFAQNSEENSRERAAEQKRIREEKDRKDREEASKRQSAGDSIATETKTTTRKVGIDTGRTGGIGSAISAFNQPKDPGPIKRDPIKLPKEEIIPQKLHKEEVKPVQQPDVIPIIKPIIKTTETVFEEKPSPTESEEHRTIEQPVKKVSVKFQPQEDDDDSDRIYSNVVEIKTIPKEKEEILEEQSPTSEESGAIYANEGEDLSQYIEDTGVVAVALYDYQAAAEDEISFDPEDVISHIEMVSFLLLLFFLNKKKQQILLNRLTKDGGEVSARIDMVSSQQIMCN